MLLSSSDRKYQPYPLSYFSVVVCLRCLLHHILSLITYTFRENRDFVFIIIVQFMMSANIRIRFGLQIVSVCLYITPSHYHHCANLSEDIEHKMPVRYILSSVWVSLSIFYQLSIIQYMGLCVFSSPISLVMIERIYALSFYHHQIGSIIHCLGLGHETMVCAVCFSIFLERVIYFSTFPCYRRYFHCTWFDNILYVCDIISITRNRGMVFNHSRKE